MDKMFMEFCLFFHEGNMNSHKIFRKSPPGKDSSEVRSMCVSRQYLVCPSSLMLFHVSINIMFFRNIIQHSDSV